jgi:hypothetical protein
MRRHTSSFKLSGSRAVTSRARQCNQALMRPQCLVCAASNV